MIRKTVILGLFILSFLCESCATVKPYERAKLNNKEMVLAPLSSSQFEAEAHVDREGSSGANGGKTGGGCGCN